MKKIISTALAALAASVMVLSWSAAAHAAVSATFSGKVCSLGMHAFVDIESKGKQLLQITGTNNVTDSRSWPYSSEVRRNWLNSPTWDSRSAYAWTDASSWVGAGSNCSW